MLQSTPQKRTASLPTVVAAGAVVLRRTEPDRGRRDPEWEVLLVHRPKYDDWSFPKGKLDRGEHATAAAVREVAEETGLTVRLGRPLDDQYYVVSSGGQKGRAKVVHYWLARAYAGDDVSAYVPNREIDQVRWVPVAKARELLTYPHDRDTLRQALKRRKKTTTLIVLRHAQARARSRWRADDQFRPLLKTGIAQADHLVPILGAYDMRVLVTSPSARCVATVVPYADAAARKVVTREALSEEDATPFEVARLVQELVEQGKRTLLCTHRPVMPEVFDALGLTDPGAEPAEMVVVHHRRGRIVATERHQVR